MSTPNPEQAVLIRYRNHRGEVADRRIVPISIHFTRSEWHPEPQWLLHALDVDKDAIRDFAMADVLSWRPA